MLNVQNVTVYFGGEALFSQISFRLAAGDRVGLVGKWCWEIYIIASNYQDNKPTFGSVAMEKNLKVGFLLNMTLIKEEQFWKKPIKPLVKLNCLKLKWKTSILH